MPANGTSALDPIFWGTSTAGAAVSAETTSTLGVARVDQRTPVDTTRIWGAQINNILFLALAMSATFKSGTRLGASTQTASPFGVTEQGLWIDTAGSLWFSSGGIAQLVSSQASQNLAFSATPAFNPAAGGIIHIGAVTANITGPTMTTGVAGQRCTIVFLKDATAGTYTIAGWASNVRTAGTLTFTSGASSLVTISFIWDDRLSTPAWVETNRTAFN